MLHQCSPPLLALFLAASRSSLALHAPSFDTTVLLDAQGNLQPPMDHAPNPRPSEQEEDDGVDKKLLKDGWCAPFVEGALVIGDREGVSHWKDVNRRECWSYCRLDPTCEQAVHEVDNTNGNMQCWLGTNFAGNPKGDQNVALRGTEQYGCPTCNSTCYAKRGFDFSKARDVKDGYCSDFVEGFEKEQGPVQCDFHSNSVHEQTHCSHWGPEYALSEIGCWTKCDALAHCTQAVYDSHNNACWVGTGVMRAEPPGHNQCPDCINKCYARHGFNGGGEGEGGDNSDDDNADHPAEPSV